MYLHLIQPLEDTCMRKNPSIQECLPGFKYLAEERTPEGGIPRGLNVQGLIMGRSASTGTNTKYIVTRSSNARHRSSNMFNDRSTESAEHKGFRHNTWCCFYTHFLTVSICSTLIPLDLRYLIKAGSSFFVILSPTPKISRSVGQSRRAGHNKRSLRENCVTTLYSR